MSKNRPYSISMNAKYYVFPINNISRNLVVSIGRSSEPAYSLNSKPYKINYIIME